MSQNILTPEESLAPADHLKDRMRQLQSERSTQNAAWNAEERELAEKIDELCRAARPQYPLASQIDAIAEVARLVHEDLPHGDHHGYPVGDQKSVCFSSQYSRINIHARAPYKARGSLDRLWEFTPEDELTFARELQANQLRIISTWRHDDGVAFIVADRRV